VRTETEISPEQQLAAERAQALADATARWQNNPDARLTGDTLHYPLPHRRAHPPRRRSPQHLGSGHRHTQDLERTRCAGAGTAGATG
jgi:hypothetical protein